MEKSLLLEIFVPTFDTDKSDGCGKVGNVGTGYPVGPNVILTARHVVEPEDRDARYPIKLRWYDYPNAGPIDGWYKLTEPKDRIWTGKGELDAALLRCPRPPTASRYSGLVSAEAPRQDARWYSAGFPRAAKHDNVRKPASFAGRMHSMAENWPHFEAGVDDAPTGEEFWKGASGMPVFAVNTMRIIGVAKEVPRYFDSRKLHATPAFKLLRDSDFQKAIGYVGQLDRRKIFESRLRIVLKRSDRAIGAIVENSGLLRDGDVNPADKASVVASRLLESPLEDVILGLSKAQDAIAEEMRYDDSGELAAAADVLAQAVMLAVPYLFDSGVASGARAHMLDPEVAILQVPCKLWTVAEIVMAAVEDRETRFLPTQSERQYPVGTRLLPHPPEAGIGASKQEAEAIRQALTGKFQPGEWGKLRYTVDDYFFKAFVSEPGGSERTRDQRIKMASIELDTISRRHRYYMAYYIPKDDTARRELEQTVSELKKDYPALVFLALTDDFDVEATELGIYGRFRDMLRHKKG